MSPEDEASRLPKWPSEAQELPDTEPPPDSNWGRWLIVGGVAYAIVGFGLLFGGGGWMGPAAWGPETILLPALIAISAVVGGKLQGERLEWSSVVGFVAWVVFVTVIQFRVWFEAVAAV